MKDKKLTKIRRFRSVFVGFLMFLTVFANIISVFCQTLPVNAVENDTLPTAVNSTEQTSEATDNASSNANNTVDSSNLTSQTSNTEQNNVTGGEVTKNVCKSSLGALGWVICPIMEKASEAVDWLYGMIQSLLVINPVKAEDGSPIYEIWKYCLGVANVVFVIFLLIVIYSQITGLGITNYGIKKVLPKLIVTAIMVNLSFLICSLAVDVSNIIGNGLRGVFDAVEQTTMSNMAAANATTSAVSMAEVYTSMAGGVALAVGAGAALAFAPGAIWMLIPTVLGAIVSVVTGLITIALRQAVVVLLVMIAPLAFVANILPNTEQWFQKWRKMLERMLVFYPMFSLLFGASSLAGFALIASAKDIFWVLLGLAVQIFPLFFSWKMMQMSGTFLGDINTRMRNLAVKPLATNRAWADSRRQLAHQKKLASGITPSARLMQFMNNRRVAREEEINELAESAKLRGQAYAANRNYRRNGLPSREGEEAYARQARNMGYQSDVERHRNNMNKGLGQLEVVNAHASKAQKARLEQLDIENVMAADKLKFEKARGEKIEYYNAKSFHNRMQDAINAHFDDDNAGDDEYKEHKMDDRAGARARYALASNVMEGNLADVQYAAASAAQGYDTQKKIIDTKMGKFYDTTVPTRDIELRLNELTILSPDRLRNGERASDNIDSIVSGLRILNQRGDTDLVKKQLDNVLTEGIGGGVELGTYASQALASFLMFEVKDSDPFLRRFGKYINLETARAYNNNDRKEMSVTYDEYVKGYHDEPDGHRMYAKKGMRQLMEGTSLDNIERTALSNLDESLKKAYGFDPDKKTKAWDVTGWLKKREEIQTAFEPAFLSSSLKWLSGSEQINSGVKFWTGYELKQKKDEQGKIMVDENGDPVYDLSPVWENEEFAQNRDEVEKYYRRKTGDYFKDQTTGQILGMRTDYRDATMEHLLQTYLSDESDDETSDERKAKYREMVAEIQTRYGDKTADEARKLRGKDMKKLKMELAGRQLRKILGTTGKLEQIYRTRRSGAANNAKDWLRGWIGLDDEESMYDEVKFYERQRKKAQADDAIRDSGEDVDVTSRVYDANARMDIRNGLEKIWEDNKDASGEEFYDIANDAIAGWFGEGETVIGKKFNDYYDRKVKNGEPDAYDLKKYLEDLLHNPDNYPDA